MANLAKKKRSGESNDVEDEAPAAKLLRRRTGEQQEETTEEEVEEFFAILRRIRESAANFAALRGDAVRRRSGSAGVQPEGRAVPAWRWRPSFEWEDFGEATGAASRHVEEDAGSGKEKRTPPPDDDDDDEEDGLRRGFDLNLEPSASEDPAPVSSSRRCERKRY